MRDEEPGGVQSVLDGVRESMSLLFDALTEPYGTLASADPDAAVGAPIPARAYHAPASVRALAERIEENGRNAWALRQVEEREAQVRGLLRDYRKGLYNTMSVGDWLAMVAKFREATLADVMTAMQAPKGWARIDLDARNNNHGALDKATLTPRDVAPQLGLDERTVRRRIQEGRLGPWKKDGRRWVISRNAFLRYWDQLAADSDLPHPPGAGEASTGASDRLDHLHL